METEDNNNILAAANILGLKILTTIAYIKAEEIGELIQLMKSLGPCKSYADKNHMENVPFFGDCNYWRPGTIIGATRNATNLEMNY